MLWKPNAAFGRDIEVSLFVAKDICQREAAADIFIAQLFGKRGRLFNGERRKFIFGDHASLAQQRFINPLDVGVERADDLDVEKIAEEAIR